MLLGLQMILKFIVFTTIPLAGSTVIPTIGIFAQPSTSSHCPTEGKCEGIAASYVKFVEAHGARVVPISYYATDEDIEETFNSINGVLFPGGGASVPDSAKRVWELALLANQQGDYFPLWGTCNGFEWLVELAGGELDRWFDSENISLPLNFTATTESSRLLSGLNETLMTMLSDPNQTFAFNNHVQGIEPSHFEATSSLTNMFSILANSYDRQGKPFVALMEGRALPFYGVQYHPEKNVWETGLTADGMPYENIPHSPASMEHTLYYSKFFVAESRKNMHSFSDAAVENAALVWNCPLFPGTEFVQSFIFVAPCTSVDGVQIAQ